jgi:hypothetical protein
LYVFIFKINRVSQKNEAFLTRKILSVLMALKHSKGQLCPECGMYIKFSLIPMEMLPYHAEQCQLKARLEISCQSFISDQLSTEGKYVISNCRSTDQHESCRQQSEMKLKAILEKISVVQKQQEKQQAVLKEKEREGILKQLRDVQSKKDHAEAVRDILLNMMKPRPTRTSATRFPTT